MENGIINRIQKESSSEDIFKILLNDISFSDLQSLLLEVYRNKVRNIECQDVLKQYEKNRFVKPSNTSPQKLNEIDVIAFTSISPDFEVIELSPVSPLGCCSALGEVNQNNIITTIRNTEVCSDMTNVLALECAKRRRELLKKNKHSVERVKLCSSHRVIRAQPNDNPNSFAHFRLFGMCTSGHDEGNLHFEEETILEHLQFYLEFIRKLIIVGYKFNSIKIDLIAYHHTCVDILIRIKSLLENMTYSVSISVNNVERFQQNYYNKMGFRLFGINSVNDKLFLVDGGFTDWTQKLLNNSKERLMISGIGTERLVQCFS